jgi:flagellar motor switch protein FliG
LPGEQARRIAFAVSHTTKVTPDAVDRIGLSLAAQIDARPDVAFEVPPDQRVGAILNVSRNTTREDVLAGLEEDSEDFAKAVRKAIFTFANIAERVQTIDVPQVIRAVDQATLVRAMASARATSDEEGASVDFLLDNMSKRMGDMLRDETDAVTGLSEEAGEDAKTEVVSAIREMAESGEITLEVPQG